MGAVIQIINYRSHKTPDSNPDDFDSFAKAEELASHSKKVLPFDSIDEVNAVVKELAKHSYRDVCLFVMGCNTQLRISDILDFKWKDILNDDGTVKAEVRKIEKKNKNPKHIYINDAIKLAVGLYKNSLSSINMSDYLFVSRGNRRNLVAVARDGDIVLHSRPLSEQLVSGIIRNATKRIGIWSPTRKFSTHSMRKTGARAAAGYLTGRALPDEIAIEAASIERVRGMLGHSNANITAKYIDLQDKFDRTVYLWMNLGLEALLDIDCDI